MDESTTDLRNTRGRLIKLAIAAAIGGVLTLFTMLSITSTGRGANSDPIGQSIMPLLGIAIFVVTTSLAHKVIAKRR
jgi:hypothetical protein